MSWVSGHVYRGMKLVSRESPDAISVKDLVFNILTGWNTLPTYIIYYGVLCGAPNSHLHLPANGQLADG